MKIYLLNDKKVPMSVLIRAEDIDQDNISARDFQLEPGGGRLIEFKAPEDSVPYIKTWNDRPNMAITLVSYLPIESLDSLDKLTKGLT